MEAKESYLHRQAKIVLSDWWKDKHYFGIYPARIDIEKKMIMGGIIQFVPDVCIYDTGGIRAFVEVEHKNLISQYKLWTIDNYCRINGLDAFIIEISAYWILAQTDIPKELSCKFSHLLTHGSKV